MTSQLISAAAKIVAKKTLKYGLPAMAGYEINDIVNANNEIVKEKTVIIKSENNNAKTDANIYIIVLVPTCIIIILLIVIWAIKFLTTIKNKKLNNKQKSDENIIDTL